ncbi:MAG: ATP-dependent ligase [Glaciihabitans sp.]|nr:ATP-dependent ligase [Glaciihabitans sp.]
MGTLTYNSDLAILIEDRALQHLQIVITSKLRRKESFNFTWQVIDDNGPRQSSVWIHESLALQYDYMTVPGRTLNRVWLEALTTSANSASGLFLLDEPAVVEIGQPSAARR